jgi:alcohol dehydrogenase (cytochrome c)
MSAMRALRPSLRLPLPAAATLIGILLSVPGCGAAPNGPHLEHASWPLYNRDLSGDRFSPQKAVTAGNIDLLSPVCRLTVEKDASFETGPVVAGDTMVLTTGDGTFAIDARTCSQRWVSKNNRYARDSLDVNRGAALDGDRLFRGATDGSFFALDLRSGKILWSKSVLDPEKGERFTMAPIAWEGRVFVGDAVSDNGMAGRVFAFDESTGRELWSTPTINAASWPKGAQTGGGGMWSSFSLDAATGELFVPVANPAPDFDHKARPGDNLYTNSVLVLDARNGRVLWHYQVTPNDEHDWDLGAAPMLYRSGTRRLVAAGSKDGHLYAIDRNTHSLVFRTPVTAISNASVPLSSSFVHVCPGWAGGVEWNGPAFDALHHQIIVGAVDWCGRYNQTPGRLEGPMGFLGGGYIPDPAASARGWIVAVDAGSGVIRWKLRTGSPAVAAITPTAAGLVFAGTSGGDFLALDSASGRIVRKFRAGGPVVGGIVTYGIGGRQYIAYATGRTIRTTFAATGDAVVTILSVPEHSGIGPATH